MKTPYFALPLSHLYRKQKFQHCIIWLAIVSNLCKKKTNMQPLFFITFHKCATPPEASFTLRKEYREGALTCCNESVFKVFVEVEKNFKEMELQLHL